MIKAWFDGGCYPINPGGTASFGVVIKQENFNFQQSGVVGKGWKMSNNVAEYCGVIYILEYLKRIKSDDKEIVIYGDSQLVINQMSRRWKAKSGLYFEYYLKAKDLLRDLEEDKYKIKFQWIPREQNTECDSLAEKVLNKWI